MITDREGLAKFINVWLSKRHGIAYDGVLARDLADALISECSGVCFDRTKFIEKEKVLEKIREFDGNDGETKYICDALKHFIESEGK